MEKYSEHKLENLDPLNKYASRSHPKSEPYQPRPFKPEKRPPLVKRKNLANGLIATAAVSLMVIIYSIATRSESKDHLVNSEEVAGDTLRLLADEDELIAMSSPLSHPAGIASADQEMDLIKEITKQKHVQADKIRELKEELADAKARILQLKTDLLVKGGQVEQYYKDKIDKFNTRLSNIEKQNNNLQTEVAARDVLIESKREEIENLRQLFVEAYEQLQREHTEEFSNHLVRTQAELEEARKTIQSLMTEVDWQDKTNQQLDNHIDKFVFTKNRLGTDDEYNEIAQEKDETRHRFPLNFPASKDKNGLIGIDQFYESKFSEMAAAKQKLENQLREAEEHNRLSQVDNSDTEALKEKLEELQAAYREEQNRSSQLESQLQNFAKHGANLKQEMASQEGAEAGNGPTTTKLRAKIAYLTSRLAQEKSKMMESEDKLVEVMQTLNDLKQRNKILEQQAY